MTISLPLASTRTSRPAGRWRRLLPGVLVASAVSVASLAVAAVETRAFGHPVIEALVVALLLGMAVRFAWTPGARFETGIRFAGKQVLEVAVMLLGASVDVPLLVRAGPALAAAIISVVAIGLGVGIGIGRVLGLRPRLAVLVACGNAICGNSAIAAVAPVIGADAEDVASSIAFTAILGVVVVLGLPLLIGLLGLSDYQYGVLAGLSVYAVPQVLAAAFPVSALAGEVATLVKLVRVLMLGPVVMLFALRERRRRGDAARARTNDGAPPERRVPGLTALVPWFIIGFLGLATLRAADIVPVSWVGPVRLLSSHLTVIAMAALGLNADVRSVARAGTRVVAAVSASLLSLVALGIGLIHLLQIR